MILGRATLENAANWKNVYIQEGREEGREEGRKEGIGEILRILLEERFGTIPESVNSFIASSDSEALTSLFCFANRAPLYRQLLTISEVCRHWHKQRQYSLPDCIMPG